MPEKSYLVTASDYLRGQSTELPKGPDCDHCVATIFDELAHEQTGVPGFVLERSSFDLDTGRLVVYSATEIDDVVVRNAVSEAGYEATLFPSDTPNAEGAV